MWTLTLPETVVSAGSQLVAFWQYVLSVGSQIVGVKHAGTDLI